MCTLGFRGFCLCIAKDVRGVLYLLSDAVDILGFHEAAVGCECNANVGGGIRVSNKWG